MSLSLTMTAPPKKKKKQKKVDKERESSLKIFNPDNTKKHIISIVILFVC